MKSYIGNDEYKSEYDLAIGDTYISDSLPDFTLYVTGSEPLKMTINMVNEGQDGEYIYLLPDENGKIDVWLPKHAYSFIDSFDQTVSFPGGDPELSEDDPYFERILGIRGYYRLLKRRNIKFNLSFWGNKKVKFLDNVENFDLSKLENILGLLNTYGNTTDAGLPEVLDLTKWSTSHLNEVILVVANTNNVKEINASNWNLSNCSNLYLTFYGNKNLVKIDLSNAKGPSTSASSFEIFADSPKLEEVLSNNTNFFKNIELKSTFSNCSNLRKFPVVDCSHGWILGTFINCTLLKKVSKEISNKDGELTLLNTDKLEVFWMPFHNCPNLSIIEEIDLSNCCRTNVDCPFVIGLFKGIGTQDVVLWEGNNPANPYITLKSTKWGSTPESLETVRLSLITYSYDRASENRASIGIRLSNQTVSALSEEERLTIVNKGYNLIII